MKLSELLDRFRIDFVTHGKNVSNGEINIKCPFCRDDPSEHLGINPKNGMWYCWRNSDHSGRTIVRLLMRLLNVSKTEAVTLAERLKFQSVLREAVHRSPILSMPSTFRDVQNFPGHARYLADRFDDKWIEAARLFQLKGSLVGTYACRIIIPYFEGETLMTWTARSINTTPIRYKTLAASECRFTPKELLYGYDLAKKGGKALVVCEGPFDAMKLDLYGMQRKVYAVSLSGKIPTLRQKILLNRLSHDFDSLWICLDKDAEMDSVAVQNDLSALKIKRVKIPWDGFKDIGACTPSQVEQIVEGVS